MLEQGFSECGNHKEKTRLCFMTSWPSNFTLLLSTQAKKFPSLSTDFSAFK